MEKNSIPSELDSTNIPAHIAIIMDGNGRWAKQRGLSRIKGHYAGVETIRDIINTSAEIGIKYLTLFAFSVENWARPRLEINQLMKLLERYLQKEKKTFLKNNIRFNTIGDLSALPRSVQKIIKQIMRETASLSGLTLTLALNYSGRSEIVAAVKRLTQDIQDGTFSQDDVSEQTFSRYLYTSGIPDPDLLIRTSGEMRISNFLLWQISYSELWITPVLWPDFRKEQLTKAILEFQKRERRFGKV